METDAERSARLALRCASLREQLADTRAKLAAARDEGVDNQRRADVAFRYWQHVLGDVAVKGDPAGDFDAEFRAVAKSLGLVPIEPADVEPELV